MSGYWLGVATPFAIVLGILLLWLAGSLFAAAVSWAWKQAHYGLLKKGWIAEDYDEDSKEWTTRPGAERLAAALTGLAAQAPSFKAGVSRHFFD